MTKFTFKYAFLSTIIACILTTTGNAESKPKEENSMNQIVLQLDPSEKNPRNSEGAFVTLNDGRILFAYSRFYGGSGDNSRAEIAARYSTDRGITWSERDVTLVKNTAEENVMSASLLRLQDGRIALFYVKKNGLHDCRLRMQTSADDAQSWTEPVLAVPAPGYFVVNNDRVLQLQNGRLIAPAAFHRQKGEDQHDMKNFDARAIAIYFISDDCGATWHESKTWWTMPVLSKSGLQEPGIIELANGRLFSWARTDQGCQYGMWSDDHGETWTPPQPTQFRSPVSPLSMKRIPQNGNLLSIWNDHSGRFILHPEKPHTGKRTPLVSAISSDDGATWTHFKQIEADPDHGYCYTAIHFVDEFVLLAYCAGGAESNGLLNRLRIRRLHINWFYE
ncbi:exo-alpha-sialidase [candidate division KSB1 bacterium]|nr:exo-alpha-sialidase [candidate division KSB1 bacterium]